MLADFEATAAILEAARSGRLPPDFSLENLVLFYDEPNMGIHLSSMVHSVTKRILTNLPYTAVLASATLPSWSQLSSMWVDPTAHLAEVTLLPHNLPMCELNVYEPLAGDEADSGVLTQCTLLDLFATHESFHRVFGGASAEQRLATMLMRFLTPAQLESLGLRAMPEHVAEFRQCHVLPAIAGLAAAEFEKHKRGWLQKKTVVTNMRAVTATKNVEAAAAAVATQKAEAKAAAEAAAAGAPVVLTAAQQAKKKGRPGARAAARSAADVKRITLVAALQPRTTARMLTGLSEEQFLQRKRDLDKAVRAGQAAAAQQVKQASSNAKAKKAVDEGAEPPEEMETVLVTLGALKVAVEEAAEMDEETRVLLSCGIVYMSHEAHPLMIRRFQMAVINVAEEKLLNAEHRPSLHTLVVGYAAVYGLDCPAIDTLVLFDDLGQYMTSDDLLQFLGRLRQDGRAVFTSHAVLCRAALRSTSVMENWGSTFEARVQPLLQPPAPKDEAQIATLARELGFACRLTGAQPKKRAELMRVVGDAVLGNPPAAGGAAFEPWRALKPWLPLLQAASVDADQEQFGVLALLKRYFDSKAWAPHAEVAKKLVIWLVNEDMLRGKIFLQWWQSLEKTAKAFKASPCGLALAEIARHMEEEGDDDEDEDEDEDGEEDDD